MKTQKGNIVGIACIIFVVAITVGVIGWIFVKQSTNLDSPQQATVSAVPNQSENKGKIFSPQSLPYVSVSHDASWVEGKDSLEKIVNDHSYLIGFQENTEDYFISTPGTYTQNARTFQEISINNKSHYVFINTFTENSEGAYLSSCPLRGKEACSPKLSNGNYLFVYLQRNNPNDRYDRELDFNQVNDKEALNEFTKILATLKY